MVTINRTYHEQLLREIVRHEEAAVRQTYETPPQASDLDQHDDWQTMMQDAVVSTCFRTLTSQILAGKWTVAGDSAALNAYALKTLDRLDMDSILEAALSALWRGFSVAEIVWTWDTASRLYQLHDIADISAEQIAFRVDEQMRIQSVISHPQTGVGTGEKQELKIGKVWLHRNEPSRHNLSGRSILEPAYRAWRAKDQLLKFWGLSLQRFGMPYIIVQVPEAASSDMISDIQTQVYRLRLDGVAVLPETVAYQVHNPTYAATLTFAEALHFHDAQIRAAMLLQITAGSVLTRDYSVSGAAAETTTGPTDAIIKRYRSGLARSFSEQLLEPLIVANFGERARDLAPRLVYVEPTPNAQHPRLAPQNQPLTIEQQP